MTGCDLFCGIMYNHDLSGIGPVVLNLNRVDEEMSEYSVVQKLTE
jgi:hypothetical protein